MACGQHDAASEDAVRSETIGQLLRRLWAAAVGIGIEAEIDGARAVAQLLKLTGVEMGSQRTSDVMKTGLPHNGVVEQTFHQNHFRVSPGLLPRIQAAFGARQEAMRGSRWFRCHKRRMRMRAGSKSLAQAKW